MTTKRARLHLVTIAFFLSSLTFGASLTKCLVALGTLAEAPELEQRYQAVLDSAAPLLAKFINPEKQRVACEGQIDCYVPGSKGISLSKVTSSQNGSFQAMVLLHEFGHRITDENWVATTAWEKKLQEKEKDPFKALPHTLRAPREAGEELFCDLLTVATNDQPDGFTAGLQALGADSLARLKAQLALLEKELATDGGSGVTTKKGQGFLGWLFWRLRRKSSLERAATDLRKRIESAEQAPFRRQNSAIIPIEGWTHYDVHDYFAPARTYLWNRHLAAAGVTERARMLRVLFDSIQEWSREVTKDKDFDAEYAKTMRAYIQYVRRNEGNPDFNPDKFLEGYAKNLLPTTESGNKRLIQLFEKNLAK